MLNWRAPGSRVDGWTERDFDVDRDGESVPGTLWTPATRSAPGPVVLLGHGASQHRRHPDFLKRQRLFGAVATVAIDAPVHGDRGGVTSPADPRIAESIAKPGSLDSMTADWQSVIGALEAEGIAAPGQFGYFGMSLGALYGAPLVAEEPRIRVAALGLAGLSGPWWGHTLPDPSPMQARMRAVARRIRCPVMFHLQWSDQMFDRDSSFELFELLGSDEKRLQAAPGLHAETPVDSLERLRDWVLAGLGIHP